MARNPNDVICLFRYLGTYGKTDQVSRGKVCHMTVLDMLCSDVPLILSFVKIQECTQSILKALYMLKSFTGGMEGVGDAKWVILGSVNIL